MANEHGHERAFSTPQMRGRIRSLRADYDSVICGWALSAAHMINLFIKIFLRFGAIAECSDFPSALARHRIRHRTENVSFVQRDLIEVHAPSRLNYSLRRRHCVLFFITPLPTMGWPKAPFIECGALAGTGRARRSEQGRAVPAAARASRAQEAWTTPAICPSPI
jgi:hypothetical protein